MKKKIIIGSCVAILLLGATAWWATKPQYIRVPFSTLFQPPEMAAAQYSSNDVVGNLGGVPVTIPKHFAEFVEYDGDPGFGEMREGSIPVRTHESKLSSFGFYVRYPDMVGMSTEELREEKRKASIYKTMWIKVGIRSGEIYPGNGFLDRAANSRLGRKSEIIKYENYEKLEVSQFDLEVYAPAGIDNETGIPYRNHEDAKDIYLNHDESGKVSAIIICSNVKKESASCTHSISLEPSIKAKIEIRYRRNLLPNWKIIQEAVIKLIHQFEINKKFN